MNYRDMMSKRFSMNFMDTLSNPSKRFSMNHLDLVEVPSVISKRFSMNFLDTLPSATRTPPTKRFSMNFLDTMDKRDMNKRFSMNYLDTIKPTKRFSMNFMDTMGSAKALASKKVLSPAIGSADMSNKRSDDRLVRAKTEAMVENIDMMTMFILENYGLEALCSRKDWRNLVNVRAFLSALLEHGGRHEKGQKSMNANLQSNNICSFF